MNFPAPSRLILPLLAAVALLFSGAGCSKADKRDRLLATANAFYLAGDYDKAEVEYLNALKTEALNAKAISRLGLIYANQAKVGTALTYLRKALELNPEDLDVRIKLAQIDLASGNPTEARTKATYVLQRRPNDPEAPLVLVGTISAQNEVEPTIALLRGLPAPAPSGAPVLTALALIEARRGRLADTESLLQQALKADPNYADAHSTRATILLSRRNIPAALESFKRAAELSPIRSPRWIQYAQAQAQAGYAPQALATLQSITAKAPDFAPAWTLQAGFALGDKKYPECEALIEKAIARDPYNLEALLLRGRLLLAQGRNADAIAAVEKVLAIYPQLPMARFELARAQAANGDLGSAIANLYQVINRTPGNTDAIMLLANLNLRKGDPAATVILLRKLIKDRPDLVKAQMLLADAYRAQKNLDDALEIYRQVEEKFPQNPETAFLRGIILAAQKKLGPARSAFEKAFTLSPDNPAPLDQLVTLDIEEGKVQAAHDRIAAAAAKNPKLAGPCFLMRGKVYLFEEKPEPAEAALLKALEIMPDNQSVYVLLAGIYTKANQVPKALEKLAQAAARDPKIVSNYMLMGFLQDQQKDFAAARDSYEKVLKIDEQNFTALNNLAYLYSEKFDKLDLALDLAQKARNLDPNEPNLADTLGWILVQKKQYLQALPLVSEAAEALPNVAEVQYHLGMTHYLLGEEQPARLALQLAVRPGANFAGIDGAKRALEIMDIDPAAASDADRARLEKLAGQNKDDGLVLMRLAAIDRQHGRNDQAMKSLESVLAINPKNVSALVTLAQLHAAKGNTAKAIEIAKAARKLAPDDGHVAQVLGVLAYGLGDYPWAASLLQESARKQDPTPDLLWDLALAVYSVGNVSDAESALRDALAPPADGAVSLFAHAKEAQQLLELIQLAGDPASASAQAGRIAQMIEAQPDNVPALMVAGTIAEKANDPAKAMEAYNKALARFPNFLPAKSRLAILGSKKHEFDQRSYDFALQARTADPTNAEIAQALGILTYYKGDFARASALLKESAVSRSSDTDLLFHLGLSQLKSNQGPEGRKNLQSALDAGLTGASATEARRLLSEKK